MPLSLNKSELKFSKFVLLRTPAFPYEDVNTLSSCLGVSHFRFAIRTASIDLYRELQKADFDYKKLNQRCRISLWKYWNRIRYRPTPFGLFSAVSVAYWNDTSDKLLIANDDLKFHVQYDFEKSQQLANQSAFKNNIAEQRFILNPTCYSVQSNLRYILSDVKEDNNRTFHICEARIDDVLNDIINLSEWPATINDLTTRLQQSQRFTYQECGDYIDALIQSQILMCDTNSQLNITGDDYLFRSGIPTINISSVQQLEYETGKLYINTERKLIKKYLPCKYQEQLKDGLECLLRFTSVFESDILKEFKEAFVRKYDRQQIPLLQALDPEIGIGYNGKLNPDGEPSLLKNACVLIPTSEGMDCSWTPAHTLLMNKWLHNESKYAPLNLNHEDLSILVSDINTLPNSFSVLFRTVNGQVLFEQAGGATGTALCGRFTPMNKEIYNEVKKLATQEEQANPKVVFAEISHIENIHTANIDRRENLYSYEIPILCGSVLDTEHQIPLSDLYISVIEDEIHLWSARLGKRVIPRLSSAYNYSRSELSVFRFLCDLQHQGLQTALSFDLQQFFPDQPFYPRVVYKNTIIQLATWIIEEAYIDSMIALSPEQRAGSLKKMAKSNHWPRYVSLNEHDNQLIFDTYNPDDFYLLAIQLKQDKKIVIKEFLPDGETVVDNDGRNFINQFIATVCHDREIYVNKQIDCNPVSVQRLFVPGSGWLYYKLYIHPVAGNEILLKNILKAVRELRRQGLLTKWFFVRYKDPDYHLRIRLQLSPKHSGYVLTKFVKVLEQLAAAGIIQKYSLDSYERELERYSPELITACEDLFCASTALIMESLEKVTADDSDYRYYYISEISIRRMLTGFGLSTEKAMNLFKNLYQGMAASISKDEKKHNSTMKERHRAIRKELNNLTGLQTVCMMLKRPLKAFEKHIDDISAKTLLWNQEKRIRLFSDLLHMHLNRLFVDDSFSQEMVLYYSYWRSLESELLR